jgi:hypothetical protein
VEIFIAWVAFSGFTSDLVISVRLSVEGSSGNAKYLKSHKILLEMEKKSTKNTSACDIRRFKCQSAKK